MNEQAKDLAVTDILRIFWLNKFLIITLACLMATLFLVKTEYFTEDQYVADGMLYIRNRTEQSIEGVIQGSDLSTSRSLSNTYIEILKSRSFLTDVSEETGGKYTWKEIKSMLTVNSVNETELLTISVKATSAEDAGAIASTIMRKAPDKLQNVLNGGGVEIIDEINSVGTLVDPGTMRKTVLGFVIGGFLGAVIAFLLNLFDKKVHKGEDVAKRYDVSILGNISQ